jgi:aldose 1-epimerase
MRLVPHVIENEVWRVGLLPATGMSTAFGQVKRGAVLVDFMRPTSEDSFHRRSDCASFLLLPWSNRLKDGKFTFRGKEHSLKVNAPDGTAIHGTARDFPWEVESADARRLVARFESQNHPSTNTPYAFSARAEFAVEGPRFVHRLSVKNESHEPVPAGFGHHPYFQRKVAGADDGVRLEVPCEEYFQTVACIPSGEPVPIDGRVDFRELRALDVEMAIDDCLTGRRPGAPIRFAYPRSRLAVSLEADALFENIVVYVPPGKPYFAVEPVTNANDGFNLFERGVRGSGVFVLEPGEERGATFTLVVEK